VSVVDQYAQRSNDVYRGFVQIYTSSPSVNADVVASTADEGDVTKPSTFDHSALSMVSLAIGKSHEVNAAVGARLVRVSLLAPLGLIRCMTPFIQMLFTFLYVSPLIF